MLALICRERSGLGLRREEVGFEGGERSVNGRIETRIWQFLAAEMTVHSDVSSSHWFRVRPADLFSTGPTGMEADFTRGGDGS
ncbi:hypothetical protein SASPL_145638 [Salvia splendens]|uniref:Uncharacterized protein n=1 Tax=Salvia splendens TaxID=180675 RepID=A0A8X8WHG6_SALSN|nr:hypothetical protein SASPL_145638 [Salvia splendens]